MNYVGRTEGRSSGGESKGQIQKMSTEERRTEMRPTQQMLPLTLAQSPEVHQPSGKSVLLLSSFKH